MSTVPPVELVLPTARRAFALRGPRGLTVQVRRAARGLYALRHPDHGCRLPAIRGGQRRALAVATRYARRFA